MVSVTRAVAILADMHGNLPALETVLADVAAHGIAEVVVAGDLVGFGTSPNADGDWAVAIARVPYDVEAAIAAYGEEMGATDLTFLALTARQLRTGRRCVVPWLELSATLRPDERDAALARFLAR
jgi:hypothetical protein